MGNIGGPRIHRTTEIKDLPHLPLRRRPPFQKAAAAAAAPAGAPGMAGAAKKKARLEGGPGAGAGGGPGRWPGKFGRLRAWLEANAGEGDLDFGALEVVEQRDGQGYSVVSKVPIEPGQPIFKVPQKCVLHMGAVLASELGRVVTASGAAVHEQTLFLLFVAMGRKDEGCFWHHHFQTMPATSAHLLSWPQELLDEEFAGTHLHAAATEEAESLRADVEAVLPAIARAFPASLVPTWEDVVWAHGCYFSRRFRPELASLRPEGSTVPCMIP